MALDRPLVEALARRELGARRTHPGREPGYVLHHGLRVAALALSLRDEVDDAEGVDADVLWAAALFHDGGKPDEPHAKAGAALAARLLREHLSAAALDEAQLFIRSHNRRGDPSLPLGALLLQDADVLDHVGAQLVWLAVQYAARHDRDPWATVEFYFSDDHQLYLGELGDSLNLDPSREAFAARRVLDEQFMLRFRDELAGEL